MAENYLQRFEGKELSLFDPYYIHYSYLTPDLIQAIHDYANGRVLDVGCGNKPYEKRFPSSVTEYVGCDVEQSSLKKVDKICSATALDFADNSFDTVFCTQVLEHVYGHTQALHEITRVLKPGGVLIGSVPMTWPHHEEPHDFFRFTRYGLEGLFEEVGLKKEYIKPNGGKWALLGQMIVLTYTQKTDNPSLLTRMRSGIFRLLLGKLWVNLIFGKLDRKNNTPEYWNTLNFVFVARKPL